MAAQHKTRQAIATINKLVPKHELLGMVAEGISIRKIAAKIEKEHGLKYSPYYVQRTLKQYGDDYRAAKEAKAQFHADRVAEVAEEVENGRIDPSSAKTSIQAHQWLAEKANPQEYGPSLKVEQTTVDLTALHLAALRERMRTKTIEARVIDVKPESIGPGREEEEVEQQTSGEEEVTRAEQASDSAM